MILDVGCGYLSDHKRYVGQKHIGIDIQKGTCNIIASVSHLPFKENVFKYIYLRNILEHIHPNKVQQALTEINRVMKQNAVIDITIPKYHNVCIDELIKILFGFPLRFYISFQRLIRWRKHMRKQGFRHANTIKPQDITRFFTVTKIIPVYYWYPLPNTLRKRLGITNKIYTHIDVYQIFCKKAGKGS